MMLTVTLLTSPDAPTLDPTLVNNLRNAWGGGDAVWLAPDEAAEFPIMTMPDNFEQVWQDCQNMKTDICVQPTGHRRKKLLLADMDSTMIEQECIDELAAEIGVGERVADITARAMNGELDFEAALDERVSLLAGMEVAVIDRVLANRISMAKGGRRLIRTMKANGAHCALISGGFTAFADQVAAELGFDQAQANVLLAENGKLTGKVQKPVLGREAKVRALESLADRQGLDLSQTMAVGDGANDLGMLHRAGTGVALHAKPSVAAQCDLRINHGDLTALLFLQGYTKQYFDQRAGEIEDFAV
jgi:phosphoserine phosphatase